MEYFTAANWVFCSYGEYTNQVTGNKFQLIQAQQCSEVFQVKLNTDKCIKTTKEDFDNPRNFFELMGPILKDLPIELKVLELDSIYEIFYRAAPIYIKSLIAENKSDIIQHLAIRFQENN
jgi:hypothetical protein